MGKATMLKNVVEKFQCEQCGNCCRNAINVPQLKLYILPNGLCKYFDEINNKVNELRKHNHDLKTINKRLIEELNELKSRKINDSTTVNMNVNSAIGFEIGSAEIPHTQRGNILSIANVLKDSGANIELVGFADAATGSDKRNMELSLARANAVADALIKCGVNKDKITVIGKGATEQIFGENDANRVVIFKTK